MIRRSAKSVMLTALATGVFVSTSAMAQSREDDERFQAAQERFDQELARFRAEFDRYQQARSGAPQAGSDDRAAPDNRYDRDDRDGPDNDDQGGNDQPPR